MQKDKNNKYKIVNLKFKTSYQTNIRPSFKIKIKTFLKFKSGRFSSEVNLFYIVNAKRILLAHYHPTNRAYTLNDVNFHILYQSKHHYQ